MAPLLFLLFLLCEVASEPVVKVIRVEAGRDVILPCDTGDTSLRAAEWIRSEPEPSEDILFWTDGHSETKFTGRVYLVNDQLKTRNVSLILKNVRREDDGTYECRVVTAGSRWKKRATIDSDPISIIQLQVTEPVVKVIRVEAGRDVILPCDTGDTSISAVEWIRSEPEPSEDILLWTDGHSDTKFTGRVYLVNDQLKTRNVSLILKNVRREDDGTYECRVATAGSRWKKRATIDSDPISIIQLQVTENKKGDNNDGTSTDLRVGFGAAAAGFVLVCLVSAAVGLFLVRKSKRQREEKLELSADEETGGIDQVLEALHQDDLVSVMSPFMSHDLTMVMGFVHPLTLVAVLSGALKLLVQLRLSRRIQSQFSVSASDRWISTDGSDVVDPVSTAALSSDLESLTEHEAHKESEISCKEV